MALAARNGDVVPLRERRPDIGPTLAGVIHRAISSHPEDRFPSAAAMAAALRDGAEWGPAPVPAAAPDATVALSGAHSGSATTAHHSGHHPGSGPAGRGAAWPWLALLGWAVPLTSTAAAPCRPDDDSAPSGQHHRSGADQPARDRPRAHDRPRTCECPPGSVHHGAERGQENGNGNAGKANPGRATPGTAAATTDRHFVWGLRSPRSDRTTVCCSTTLAQFQGDFSARLSCSRNGTQSAEVFHTEWGAPSSSFLVRQHTRRLGASRVSPREQVDDVFRRVPSSEAVGRCRA